MPFLHVLTGSYHRNDCEKFDIDLLNRREFYYLQEEEVENGFYPKGRCCYEPSAGDSPSDYIKL